MTTGRCGLRIPLVAALLLAFAACSPYRAIEAAWVLADMTARDGASTLKTMTPQPQRAPVAYRIAGRVHDGDLYQPGNGTRAGIVLVPGVAEAGKDDRRLVAFATTLARARFAVLVPDIGALRALRVRAGDSREIADAVAYLVSLDEVVPDGRIGIAAISYAVGPALIAALEPDVRDRVRFIVGIGGYHDIEAVVTFFTTGYYRERPGEPWRYREPNAYGKWVFVLSNVDRIDDPADRSALEAMARRKLKEPGAEIADLAAGLGREGRAFYALLSNTDPERVPALIEGLPAAVWADMTALDLARRDLGRLKARLILVHGREDAIIPYSESRALAAAIAGDRADLFIVDGFAHVDAEVTMLGRLQLLRAVYRLLAERDAGPAT